MSGTFGNCKIYVLHYKSAQFFSRLRRERKSKDYVYIYLFMYLFKYSKHSNIDIFKSWGPASGRRDYIYKYLNFLNYNTDGHALPETLEQ